MINNVNPYSIKQDLITDCSFVASLCIASAFERRFHKQLITGIIYPQAWHTTLLFLLRSLLLSVHIYLRFWHGTVASVVRGEDVRPYMVDNRLHYSIPLL